MPLIVVDLIAGRSVEQVQALLDAVHDAVVEALAVPQRDRYQIVHEHDPYRPPRRVGFVGRTIE